MPRLSGGASLLILLCSVVACRDGHPTLSGGMVVRDSAGVHIVLNTAPAWPRESAWTVVDTPFFDAGGSPGTDFQDVVSVVRTRDGALAVADGGDQRIRVFNGAGEVVRILGARGTGPGEFRSLSWMTAAGDSLLAYDAVERRLTLFGAYGRVRTAALDVGNALFNMPVGRFRDGTLLVESGGPRFPFPGRPGQVRRDSALLLRADAEGHVQDTLAHVPWSESFGVALGSGDRRFMAPMPRPFARRTSAVVLHSGFAVGEGGTYVIDVYSHDGTLQQSMRRNRSGAPVTPEAIHAFADARRAQPPGSGLQGSLDSALVTALDSAPFPSSMPVFERVLADEVGNLWVEEYSIRGGQPRHWSVFNDSGRWLGDVSTPAGFDPQYITGDALYGVWRAGGEVPRVRGYALVKR
ncbi:MAG TPA: hypothetical protein VFK36_04895 [Gemmatimonadales bacterium]|nr:hypothetical protein [Gemmatimonadales bacterium]